MKTGRRQNESLCSLCFSCGILTILKMLLCYVALVLWIPIDSASFLKRIKHSLRPSLLESLCRRAKRYMCAVKSFLGSFKHHSLKPVDSPNAACVRPDGFRQSGPLTIPLMPSSFAYSVGSPNVTCVRPNRFRSTKPSLSYFFTFRETRRGCTQRVSGGRFVMQFLRAPLFGPLECHQTQPT